MLGITLHYSLVYKQFRLIANVLWEIESKDVQRCLITIDPSWNTDQGVQRACKY